MNLLRELFTPNKVQSPENFIWYNDELKKCCWGSIEEFNIDKMKSNHKDNCKLICKPEIDSKNCRAIVEEINFELEKKQTTTGFITNHNF